MKKLAKKLSKLPVANSSRENFAANTLIGKNAASTKLIKFQQILEKLFTLLQLV